MLVLHPTIKLFMHSIQGQTCHKYETKQNFGPKLLYGLFSMAHDGEVEVSRPKRVKQYRMLDGCLH